MEIQTGLYKQTWSTLVLNTNFIFQRNFRFSLYFTDKIMYYDYINL